MGVSADLTPGQTQQGELFESARGKALTRTASRSGRGGARHCRMWSRPSTEAGDASRAPRLRMVLRATVALRAAVALRTAAEPLRTNG